MPKKKTEPNVSTAPLAEIAPAAPIGRPSSFRDEYITQTEKLCALGATDDDLADFFDISLRTLNRWKVTYPAFLEALRRGKDPADDRVEDSLYQKALPREIEEEQAIKLKDVVYDNGKRVRETERVEVVKVRKLIPADTTAIIFWLKNRRPHDWRDVHKHEHGKAGAFDQLSPAELDEMLVRELKVVTPYLPKIEDLEEVEESES